MMFPRSISHPRATRVTLSRPVRAVLAVAALLAALLAASAYADELRHVSLPDARYADADLWW